MKIFFCLFFILLLSFALANEQDDCTEIRNYLDRDLLGRGNLSSCIVNDDGKVSTMKINNYDLTKKEIDKLLSYNTINVLEFSNIEVDEIYVRKRPLESSSFILDNLTNLEDLSIVFYDSKYSFEISGYEVIKRTFDNLKLPKSLKKLQFTGIKFSQNDIDEISTLTKLEELTLVNCEYDDLNLKSLENLGNISSLILNESITFEILGTANTNILKFMKPLKKLVINDITLTQENINDIATLNNLEDLLIKFKHEDGLDFSSFENLSKLTYLKLEKAYYNSYEHLIPTNFIKNLSNLKNLTIYLLNINEDNIKEINSLVSLESLELYLPTYANLDLTFNNLSNLIYLYIYGSNNVTIDFPNSENLKQLFIFNIKCTQKIIDDISNLTSLENLTLSGMEVSGINFDDLSNLSNLTELNFSSSQNILSEIPSFVFNLKLLKKLSLMFQNISSIPSDISNLQNLEELDLSFNRISVIPEAITSLKNLKSLVLNDNQLSSISKNISNNENLENLILNNNGIKNLPVEISSLKNLKIINLSSNRLTSLPDGFFDITEIETLKLDDNRIKSISDDIGNLKNLKELSINNNQIASIPSSLSKCESLVSLNLNSNMITSIPSEIGDLKNLEELFIGSNRLEGEIPESLNNLTNLRIFDIGNNYNASGKVLTISKLETCNYGFLGDQFCMTKETLCISSVHLMCNGDQPKYISNTPFNAGPNPIDWNEWLTSTTTVEEVQPTTTITTIEAPTSTDILQTPTTSTNEIQCLAELKGYSCCDSTHTKVYYEDDYGEWGYDFDKKEWCGITPYTANATNDEECWSKPLGYSCCKGCGVIEVDKDGSWGYERNKWCGIPTYC